MLDCVTARGVIFRVLNSSYYVFLIIKIEVHCDPAIAVVSLEPGPGTQQEPHVWATIGVFKVSGYELDFVVGAVPKAAPEHGKIMAKSTRTLPGFGYNVSNAFKLSRAVFHRVLRVREKLQLTYV